MIAESILKVPCPICKGQIRAVKIKPQAISDWDKDHPNYQREVILTCCHRIYLVDYDDNVFDYGDLSQVTPIEEEANEKETIS
jgi:hypothetical protein